MSIWYRVTCDRHQPPPPVCDIEHDRATGRISLYPQTVVRVPELVDTTDLDTRVQARADAIRKGETPPKFSDGLITTSHADMIRGEGFWITCLICKLGERKKKLSARVQSDEMLGWVLDRIGDTLITIDDVEVREQVDRAEWEADPTQPRWSSCRVTMRLLPLYDLQRALTNNPRGGSTA